MLRSEEKENCVFHSPNQPYQSIFECEFSRSGGAVQFVGEAFIRKVERGAY